jgi:spermidine/putrescine ABC transporter ATP-binding subunit
MAFDLVLNEVTKTYSGAGPVVAVNDVSLSVARGEFLTLLGPSGCGKTTLLRLIGGFLSPSHGRILVQGKDVTDLPPQKRPTAMVFQNYALFPHMTAAENVGFGLKVRRLPKPEIAQRVQKALAVVNLAQAGNRYPSQLSGGQQQRVAVARALAVDPPVLLMDEPLGALDAKLRDEMQVELCAIQQRLGITTVYVTHDQEEAFGMSDRVAVMNHGRILQLGAPDDIYRKPRSAFVADFIGRSNLLRGIVSAEPGRIEGIDVLKFVASAPIELAPGAEVVLVLRPEDVVLGGSTDADNHFEGTIERRRFTGGTHLYYIRVSPNLIIAAEDRDRIRAVPGERVKVSWQSSRSLVLPAVDSDDGISSERLSSKHEMLGAVSVARSSQDSGCASTATHTRKEMD